MTPEIKWEKWIDPFGKDDEESKWNDYDIEDNKYNDSDISHEIIKSQKQVKVISSPMGLIPYNEHTAPGNIFNFWIGHTNFNITYNISNLIKDTNGVEILDIFTRYRFRIAIGKCFDETFVKKEINDILCFHMNTND